jgi:hypothetical protein
MTASSTANALFVLPALVQHLREMQPRHRMTKLHVDGAFEPALRAAQIARPLFHQPAFEQCNRIVRIIGQQCVQLRNGLVVPPDQPEQTRPFAAGADIAREIGEPDVDGVQPRITRAGL